MILRTQPIPLAVPLFWMALCGPVVLTGCAQDDQAGLFQEYTATDAVVSDRQKGGNAKSLSTVAGGNSPKTAAPASPRKAERPFSTALQAGIGFFSLPLLHGGTAWAGNARNAAAVSQRGALSIENLRLSLSSQKLPTRKQDLPAKTAVRAAVKKRGTGRNVPRAIPRKLKLLIKNKTFRVEGPQKAIRVTYDDLNLLKVLNMEPVPPNAAKLLPKWLKNLHGKRIRIRGFMSEQSVFQLKGNKGFLLGRDNQACCFPGNAKVYDLFPVKMRDGVTVDLILRRPFDVVGIFKISPWVEDGKMFDIYRIEDAVVIQ